MFENSEIIHTYTRKEALADGVQVSLASMGEDVAALAKEAGYKWPIYLTSNVAGLIGRALEDKRDCNDLKGVVWDILWMSRVYMKKDSTVFNFPVIFFIGGKQKECILKAEAGATDIDDPTPCIIFSSTWE